MNDKEWRGWERTEKEIKRFNLTVQVLCVVFIFLLGTLAGVFLHKGVADPHEYLNDFPYDMECFCDSCCEWKGEFICENNPSDLIIYFNQDEFSIEIN